MDIQEELAINIMADEEKKKKCLKAFYAACHSKGITDEERMELIGSYGREHASDMTIDELRDVLAKINKRDDTEEGARGKWIRRAMDVTSQYLNKTVKDKESVCSEYVKEVITTSQRGINFNSLTTQQLFKAFYLLKTKWNMNKILSDRRKELCKRINISEHDYKSKSRCAKITILRFVVWNILLKEGFRMQDIGEDCHKDRNTIRSGNRVVEECISIGDKYINALIKLANGQE